MRGATEWQKNAVLGRLVREVLSDEMTSSRDLKEVRKQVVKRSQRRVYPTEGTPHAKVLKSGCLA